MEVTAAALPTMGWAVAVLDGVGVVAVGAMMMMMLFVVGCVLCAVCSYSEIGEDQICVVMDRMWDGPCDVKCVQYVCQLLSSNCSNPSKK